MEGSTRIARGHWRVSIIKSANARSNGIARERVLSFSCHARPDQMAPECPVVRTDDRSKNTKNRYVWTKFDPTCLTIIRNNRTAQSDERSRRVEVLSHREGKRKDRRDFAIKRYIVRHTCSTITFGRAATYVLRVLEVGSIVTYRWKNVLAEAAVGPEGASFAELRIRPRVSRVRGICEAIGGRVEESRCRRDYVGSGS